MFSLLLVIHCSGIIAANTGTAVMNFYIHDPLKGGNCLSNYMTISEDAALELRFIYYEEKVYNIRCYADIHLTLSIELNSINEFDKFTLATVDRVPNYGKQWFCQYWDSFREGFYICNATFHLRTVRPKAIISLNTNQVKARIAELSKNYDGMTEYQFEENETAIVDCNRPSADSGWVKIRYEDETGNNILETGFINTQTTILLKLTRDCNKRYIDCIYSSTDNDISVTRLNLYLQDAGAPKSILTLQINGMKIRTTPNTMTTYKHFYYDGEQIEIICEMRSGYNWLQLYVKRFQGVFISPTGKVNENLLLKNEDSGFKYECFVKDRIQKNIESVNIQFIRSQHEFYVTGLNYENVLAEYKESMYSLEFFYQYSDGERLSLTCTKIHTRGYPTSKPEWMLNDQPMKSTFREDNNKYWINHVIVLHANHNNSIVKCKYYANDDYMSSISIKLIHKKAPDIGGNDNGIKDNGIYQNEKNDTEIIINKNNGNGSNDSGKNDNENDVNGSNDTQTIVDENNVNGRYEDLNGNENPSTQWIYLAVGIGIIIIISISVACLVNRNKRNKGRSSESNNMNSPSKSVKVLPNLSDKGRQETHSKQHYQNKMEVNLDNTEPVLHYAEIVLPNNKAKCKKDDAPEYAQIMTKSNAMKKKENDYENLSHGARYVNCQVGKELAEPAYCEVLLARE